MGRKVKKLVVDTAAFVKHVPLWEHAEEFYCVSDVIKEIRDRQTRNHVDALPLQLQFREPSSSSVKFINDFTKQTGDFGSLSLADVKVLALTYELEVEAKGTGSHLRTEPLVQRTEQVASRRPPPNGIVDNIEGFYCPKNDGKSSADSTVNCKNSLEDEFQSLEVKSVSNKETEEKDEVVATNKTSNSCDSESDEIEENGEEAENEYVEEDNEYEEEDNNDYDSSYESDDEEGWITPSSLKAMKSQKDGLDDALMEATDVACITSDYSMQNTLKHIGLQVMGVDGKLINSLRTFILRCFACGKTTDKLERLFCHYCGHKTLKKVSVTLNPDGSQKIWISTKKPINIRGTKYSLPRPRGGKHGINPILVADQRRAQQRVTKQCRKRNDPMNEDYDARCGVSPFMTRDVYSRSAQLGIKLGKKQHRGVFYWEQRNPNVPLNKGTRKKKR